MSVCTDHHRLYIGNPHSLEKQFFKHIAALKEDDPLSQVLVLVENNLAGIYLRRRLALLGDSHCRVVFLTISDLAYRLARSNPKAGQVKPLPRFTGDWLAAVTACRAETGYFGPLAHCPGFIQALKQLFQELMEAGLVKLPDIPGSDPLRLKELQRLYLYYRERLGSFLSPDLAYRLARQEGLPEGVHLIVYGCHGFSRRQRQFLQALFKKTQTTFYWQATALNLPAIQEVYSWLEVNRFTVHHLQAGAARGNLHILQQQLFNTFLEPVNPVSADQGVQLICSPDAVREVQEISRGIMARVRRGAKLHEMAVLVSDQSYYPLLKDTFNRLGIGYYLPGDLSLAQTRSGRGLLLFLELIDSGFERSSVLELVSYAPFDFNRLLNTPLPVSPALWEQLALEAKVTRGQEQWLTALKRLSSRLLTQERETGESASDKLNSLDSFIRFLARLFTEAAGFTSLDRWSSFAAACLQFLDSFFVYDPEQEPLRQCLKQLGQLEVCREKVAFIQARQMLRQALQTIQIPAGSFQRSGVNILPLSAASGIRFKTVFIPGLVEKSFPAIPPPDPLLPEQERVALQGVLPLRHEQLQRESLAFALAVNSATEALVLSWPRLDIKSSREYFPSLFVFEAGRALTGIRPPLDQLPALPGFTHVSAELHPGGPEQALSVEEYDLACCASLVSPARPSDYLRKLDPLLQRAVRLENARQSAKLTPYQGVLTGSGSGLTKSISRFKSSVSATALEEYATCPYLFYLKRLLKIKPTPEIEEMVPLNPLQRGKLVHRILELFYRELLSRVMDSPGYPEYSGDLLNRISDEQFARLEKSGEVNTGLLWEIERGRLRFLLQEYLTWELTHAGPLSPYRFEASFGMGFPDDGGELSADSIKRPAVSLSLGSEETLYFRGRIDRVDRGNRGLRIIDYKTGRKRIKKDHSLEGGTALQLPVYLLASRSLFGEEDIQWMEACYIHLTPGKVETVTFDGEPWDQVKAQLVSVVEILYRGISRGLFFPFPEGREGNCRYCDYRAICGPEVEQVFARKLADPLMSEFLKLRDPAVEGS